MEKSRSRSQEWGTPYSIYQPLHEEFGFTLDAAATAENAKCVRFYSAKDDALAQEWRGTVWCNPPFARAEEFVRKAEREAYYGRATTVMLIPVRSHTAWWHDVVVPRAEIRWIRDRFKFVGAPYNAPFPTCIVIFRPAAAVEAHDWIGPTELLRWPHCRACGIIKRSDGKNSPECKGAPRIALRADAGMPFEQDTMTHEPN
jgi:site-specific DNA-methyltransferase (adenine-specific)